MLPVLFALFLGANAAIAAEVNTDSLVNEDLRKSRGIPWVLPPGDDAWLRPHRIAPSPRLPGAPEDQFAAIDALFAEPELQDDETSTAPRDNATIPIAAVEMDPKYFAWPRVPVEVAKRKINEAVHLQALVGPDGRVVDVRVLRGIPRCRECVESAVLATMQNVYDTPDPATLPFGVWTMPFEIRFNYSHD